MSAVTEVTALARLAGSYAGSPVRASLVRRELPLQGGILPAFEALRHDPYPWLLDSALRQPGRGRYSFAGSDPYLVLRAFGRRVELECRRAVRPDLEVGRHVTGCDPLDAVRALLPRVPRGEGEGEAPFAGGAVGYLGYELVVDSTGAHSHGRDDLALPDLALLFVDRLVAFDHHRDVACVYALGFDSGDAASGADAIRSQRAELAASQLIERLTEMGVSRAYTSRGLRGVADVEDGASHLQSDLDPDTERDPDSHLDLRAVLLSTSRPRDLHSEVEQGDYGKSVATIVDEIAAGNVYQGNLTQRMDLPCAGDSWSLYRRLRALNPAPFGAYLSLPEVDVLSSSPERFLRVAASGELESCPIKGTRPRGANGAADSALEAELAASSKDRAENLMIVDLVRNDLGRVCDLASIEVPQLMVVEPYATVFQMVSRVTGRLAEGRDAIDAVRAAFPPGSMTGAPKIAAMRLLDRLEPTRRAVYSGAVGYLDVGGGADLSVVIRTILVQQGRAYLHVGGGVVADSQPAAEYRESIDKARALWAALSDPDSHPV